MFSSISFEEKSVVASPATDGDGVVVVRVISVSHVLTLTDYQKGTRREASDEKAQLRNGQFADVVHHLSFIPLLFFLLNRWRRQFLVVVAVILICAVAGIFIMESRGVVLHENGIAPRTDYGEPHTFHEVLMHV
jgi:hypothetical protein